MRRQISGRGKMGKDLRDMNYKEEKNKACGPNTLAQAILCNIL